MFSIHAMLVIFGAVTAADQRSAWLEKQLFQQRRYQAEWQIAGVWGSGRRIPAGTRYLHTVFRLSRSDDAWKCEIIERRTRFHRGKLETRESGDLYLVNSGVMYCMSTDARLALLPGHSISYEPGYAKGFMPPTRGDLAPFVRGLSPLTARPLTEFFRDPNSLEHTSVGPVELLTARGEFGVLTLEFDSSRGNCLSAASEQLGPDDLSPDGVKLKDIPENEGGPFDYKRSNHKVTAFRHLGDRYYPAEWRYELSSKSAGVEPISYTHQVRLTKLVIDPTFDSREFDPSRYFKEGSPVQYQGQETVAFEWRNGQPVKSVDRSEAQATYDYAVPARSVWLWTLGSVLAVGVVVGAWVTRHYWTAA